MKNERSKVKVGHLTHMRVNTKSLRNKIFAKGRYAPDSQRIKDIRSRSNDQGLWETKGDGLPF